MLKTLEHTEHAEHIAHAGAHKGEEGAGHGHAPAHGKTASAQVAALLVAALAAGLAIAEQGGKHAEIKVDANMIAAVDAWNQYQAKSIRATVSRDIVAMISTMEPGSTPDIMDRRKKTVERLNADQERYDKDPNDGREAIAHRAREFEEARNHALEQTHAYHNGAAAMELGIVLATASAIIGSRLLIGLSMTIGLVGIFCAVAGYLAPEYGAF